MQYQQGEFILTTTTEYHYITIPLNSYYVLSHQFIDFFPKNAVNSDRIVNTNEYTKKLQL